MTQTREATIAGLTFTISTPYAEGHVCTPAEAKALNQTRTENISNATRKKIDALADAEGAFSEAATAEAVALVAEYDANYVFTLASVGGGRAPADPVEREALSIARGLVTAQLKGSGRKVKDVDADKLAAKIAEVAEMEQVIAQAKKNVNARTKMADGIALDF